jgi:2,4-diketo-3-deoxy-L-fuconate hydrolase
VFREQMRVANLRGRLVVLVGDGGEAVDVEAMTGGVFGSDPQQVFSRWDEFVALVAESDLLDQPRVPLVEADLGSPVPRPGQIFAIGLNYRDHASETGAAAPPAPVVFTKFASCITGPRGDVVLPPGGHTDWEIELVAVIGRTARHVPEAEGWSYIAGLSVGQDLSERITQLEAPPAQFSLGKSFPRFGPIGPWLVTPDEFADRDDLLLECEINGESVQTGRTRDLIFPVANLVHRLSTVLTLEPGDVIFTGTPAGVGMGRVPPRWLADGDELVSRIEGIGELRHRLVTAS